MAACPFAPALTAARVNFSVRDSSTPLILALTVMPISLRSGMNTLLAMKRVITPVARSCEEVTLAIEPTVIDVSACLTLP